MVLTASVAPGGWGGGRWPGCGGGGGLGAEVARVTEELTRIDRSDNRPCMLIHFCVRVCEITASASFGPLSCTVMHVICTLYAVLFRLEAFTYRMFETLSLAESQLCQSRTIPAFVIIGSYRWWNCHRISRERCCSLSLPSIGSYIYIYIFFFSAFL